MDTEASGFSMDTERSGHLLQHLELVQSTSWTAFSMVARWKSQSSPSSLPELHLVLLQPLVGLLLLDREPSLLQERGVWQPLASHILE